MLAKRIIPCLDVDDGRVVKGVKFVGIQDAGDPVELARRYNDEGADELVFLDIGASYKSRQTLIEVVRRVAKEVFIPLCVGGGIRSVEDMREAMNAGADKISVCTAALRNPHLITEMAQMYGSQCVVLSIDAKRVDVNHDTMPPSGYADSASPERHTSYAYNAWRPANNVSWHAWPAWHAGHAWHAFAKGGREDTGIDVIQWAIQAVELGAGEILLNSIDADGTGDGYDLELTRAVGEAVPVPVIASGGAGNLDQIVDALLPEKGNADAALVASMLHFRMTTISEIKHYAEQKGVCIRW
jgi:cyclase